MKKSSLTFVVSCVGLLLSSCASVTPLKPGAENVMISDGSHLPQCKEVGHVIAFDSNGSSVAYTSHENLQQSQTNILKNKAYKMGGNVLVITKHETTYSSHKDSSMVDTHQMEGDVYLCSSTALQTAMPSKASSDLKLSETGNQ